MLVTNTWGRLYRYPLKFGGEYARPNRKYDLWQLQEVISSLVVNLQDQIENMISGNHERLFQVGNEYEADWGLYTHHLKFGGEYIRSHKEHDPWPSLVVISSYASF